MPVETSTTVDAVTALLAAFSLLLTGGVAQTQAHAARSPRPPINHRWIPYGHKRKSEMAAYAKRHYGTRSNVLHPRVLVEHWTQSTTASPVFDEFRSDTPDIELHELPGLCSHFIVDTNGRIYQLVPLGVMCRHTVGLNDRAIGVENVGMSDSGVMNNTAQRTATVRLARFLRCRFNIQVRDIIGHSESLRSRFHHERVRSLRGQTHDDMERATMNRFRAMVARTSCG
ncbi:MAG: peptidoglycan recognition family protein [Solirubrobacterales bacterium]|nr:peptidoglycan recognition family protein [Solirubrobacterales bacterium]